MAGWMPVTDQWQVQYARFVIYDTTVEHPSLERVSKNYLRAAGGGVWISSAASVSLNIVYQPSSGRSNDPVLVVGPIRDRDFEEHYISRLHFSWPQVSCVAGFPPRGTKTVLVTYKDDTGKIQKFALRFSIVAEAEKFINILKLTVQKLLTKESPPPQLQAHEFSSTEISSQAEFKPSNEVYRPVHDSIGKSLVEYGSSWIVPISGHNNAAQGSTQVYEAAMPMETLPPSFTQLVKNCGPQLEAKPTESAVDIQTQFARYLREASFTELLSAVENVLKQAGDDFLM